MTDFTDSMFGGSRRGRKAEKVGWKRIWNASRRTGAFGCFKVSCLKSMAASLAFEVEGFSSKTCLPAFNDLSAHSKCRPLGRGM